MKCGPNLKNQEYKLVLSLDILCWTQYVGTVLVFMRMFSYVESIPHVKQQVWSLGDSQRTHQQ